MKTVYILTNEAMPGIIKIGWTDKSVEERMKELDKTATPLPFTCYFAKRVDEPTFVEAKLHQAFDEFRISKIARYTSNFTPDTEPFPDKG